MIPVCMDMNLLPYNRFTVEVTETASPKHKYLVIVVPFFAKLSAIISELIVILILKVTFVIDNHR